MGNTVVFYVGCSTKVHGPLMPGRAGVERPLHGIRPRKCSAVRNSSMHPFHSPTSTKVAHFTDSSRVLKSSLVLTLLFGLLWGAAPLTAEAQSATEPRSPIAEKELIMEQTTEWEGERYETGRPKVSDELLERMKNVTLEMAWSTLRGKDYHNQVPNYKDWSILEPEETMVGRAVTAQYMPSRPSYESRLEEGGEAEGFQGPSNTWPIQLLEEGDIYVADGYGKIKDGTLIGDRLGTDIFARSQNGVVVNGSVRDVAGLQEIDGWNHYIREAHPSFIQEMMLEGVNVPIRIGEATVLPGDVVLARNDGVIFIPPHLAREVVREAEITILTDRFAKVRTREGVYSSSQIDAGWTEEIKDDFYSWADSHKEELPVPADRIEAIVEERLID